MSVWIAVALGGALGAVARFAVSGVWLPVQPGQFPTATLIVNVLGSLLMGIGYYWLVQKGAWPDSVRLLLMTGFLGAFTTFAAFSIELVTLATRGQIALALWYAAASLVTCVAAAGVGWWAAQKLF